MNTIANTILNQLGGYNRLDVMLGLKDAMSFDNGLSFKIKSKSSVGNYVKIVLDNTTDLYNIEIGKIRGCDYKVLHEIDKVYVNDLKQVLIDNLKVRLSL